MRVGSRTGTLYSSTYTSLLPIRSSLEHFSVMRLIFDCVVF